MCGVAGLYARRWQVNESVLHQMTERLFHRGPIEDGYYISPPLYMGMRRLSIIDIESGQQPVYNEDRTIAVMLNGQIYNYVELMENLQKRGHTFYTRSDTEVIAHMYEEVGVECLHQFNGMFAMAIWDVPKQRLFVARDRLGVKPLYYYDGEDAFVYASELKSLLICPFIPRDLDPGSFDDYLTLMYIRAPRTPFKSISKLMPGHYIDVNSSGVQIRSWWNLREHCEPSHLSLSQASQRILEVLDDSTRIRLRSDVPVGSFLSGGIDSSAITALASRHLSNPINTYAVGFDGGGVNELGYAQIVADTFKTQHHSTMVTVDDALQHLPLLLWHLDEPHADSAVVPTYLVSKVAAQDLRVILSGLGGDELFGGYSRYFDGFYAEHIYRLFPLSLRQSLFAPLLDWINPFLGLRAQRNQMHFAERYLDSVTIFPPSMRSALCSYSGDHVISLTPEFTAYPRDDAVNRLMFVDALTYLPDDVLHITDRMSMAVSLEARTPFLDYRMVELAASLPGYYKLNQVRRTWKIALKQAMNRILPSPILNRRKWGFGAPVSEWMQKGLIQTTRNIFRDPLSARIGLINRSAALHYIQNPLPSEGQLRPQRLWALLVLEVWARVFLEGDGVKPTFTLKDLVQ